MLSPFMFLITNLHFPSLGGVTFTEHFGPLLSSVANLLAGFVVDEQVDVCVLRARQWWPRTPSRR